MGNVFAASTPPRNFGIFSTPPDSEAEDEINIGNPGTMEDLHKKTQDIFPTAFDGARFVFNKGLSSHFQISHNIFLSPQPNGFYRFGATYAGTNEVSPGEAYPVLTGNIDANGQLSAYILDQIGTRMRLRIDAQMSGGQFSHAGMQVEYKANTFTSSLAVMNPDLLNEFQGILVGQFLQNITPKFSFGSELELHRMKQIPGGQLALFSLAARYTGADYVCSGTLGAHKLHLCFYQKAGDLQFGVQMKTDLLMHQSVATIGYNADMPKANLQFKGSVDTNWNVSAVLEKKLLPMPFTLALSGHLNHKNNSFKLGLCFVIG